jgi:preprotein translocase subunit SecA
MFNWILKTIVGSKNQRELRRIQPLIDQINEIEQRLGELSDDDLRGKTAAWKEELSAITDSNALEARLQEILPEAFAVVKQGARRLSDRKHTFTVCDQPTTW